MFRAACRRRATPCATPFGSNATLYARIVLYGSAYAFVGHLLLSHVQFAGDCSCAGDVSVASGVSEALMHALMRLLPSSSRTTGSSLGVVKV